MQIEQDGEKIDLRVIRAEKIHRSYILSTWVKSYASTVRRQKVSCTKETVLTVPLDVYLANEPKVAESLWDRAYIVTGDDGISIHGWVCGDIGKLWHIYVPPGLRRKGLASALIRLSCGDSYEYARPWPFESGLPGEATYNPYLLTRYNDSDDDLPRGDG